MRTIFFLLLVFIPASAHADTVWFKGLFGDAFSTGIIAMAESYGEEHHCWCRRETVAKEVIQKYNSGKIKGPVNIVGHSLGANAAMNLAEDLRKAKVPVGRVITLDPTIKKDMSKFDAYNFVSRDWRARNIPGAKEYYLPRLSHVPLAKDKWVQDKIKELINAVS